MRARRDLVAEAPVSDALCKRIELASLPLTEPADRDAIEPLLRRIGNARYVLLGEASHGTAEFYRWRTAITRHLIQERGFKIVAVEGDWPECSHVNAYIRARAGADANARDALRRFSRWPTWLWANEETIELVEFLRRHNDASPGSAKVGFYGLDVYSLWDSLYLVMGYLRRKDAAAYEAALQAFRCFEPYGEDAQEYARTTRFVPHSCEDEVVTLLRAVRGAALAHRPGDPEAAFEAEQNALVLKNAEAYYRAMVRGGAESWNIRDRHMTDTLERLMLKHGPTAKAIVWEHNTHIGDARFTDMAADGMVNVGQLVRERHPDEGAVLVGFSSYEGTVTAAREWGAPLERVTVPAARAGSWEAVLHYVAPRDRLLVMPADDTARDLNQPRGQRAIGVVYRPQHEHSGNYVPTVLPHRYDALFHLERTEALHFLAVAETPLSDAPETYPSGV